jgi:broad specificity phosphatase PhoE
MTRLLLIRHAETELTATVLLGRTPGVHLSQNGAEQSRRLQNFIPSDLSKIVSSPIERASETAAIATSGRGLNTIIDQAFNELDYGTWSGMRFEDLERIEEWKMFNRNRESQRAPCGENLCDVKHRIIHGIERLIIDYRNESVAIFTHGDVIRTALSHFAGAPLACFDRFRIDPASLSEVEIFSDGQPRIVSVNYRG